MISSPPQEAAEFRGKTLTPVSPKPVHYPSPSNIPILEKQMDPMFHEQPLNIGLPQQDPTSSDPSSSGSLYAEQSAPSYDQNAANNNGLGNGNGDYAKSLEMGNRGASSNQDTTAYQNFAQQPYSTAAASGDSSSAPPQADRAPVPHPYDSALLSAAATQNPLDGNSSQGYAPEASSVSNGTQGGVNFQTLLDNLSATIPGFEGNNTAPTQSSPAGAISPASALPGNLSLPPRPPPQEKPATHPNYAPDDDIRSYHPHSQKNPAAAYRSQGLAPLVTGGAPGAPQNGPFQTPMSATQRTQSPSTPGYRQRDATDRRSDEKGDEDAPWGPEVQKLYDEFLHDEREYVTEGQWDKFPPNSRLFIGRLSRSNTPSEMLDCQQSYAGNLPTEKVTKRDLFHIFHKHGKLAQISIKQAYGFVQFLESNACYRALQSEQGMMVRGRKMRKLRPLRIFIASTNIFQTSKSRNRRGTRAMRMGIKILEAAVDDRDPRITLVVPQTTSRVDELWTDSSPDKVRPGSGISVGTAMTTGRDGLHRLGATAAVVETGVGTDTMAVGGAGRDRRTAGADTGVPVRGETPMMSCRCLVEHQVKYRMCRF